MTHLKRKIIASNIDFAMGRLAHFSKEVGDVIVVDNASEVLEARKEELIKLQPTPPLPELKTSATPFTGENKNYINGKKLPKEEEMRSKRKLKLIAKIYIANVARAVLGGGASSDMLSVEELELLQKYVQEIGDRVSLVEAGELDQIITYVDSL